MKLNFNYLKNRKKAVVITVGNYKGGAGKTSNSTLIGYRLAKQGVRVLVADLDPQTNATKELLLTKSALEKNNIMKISKTIMAGVAEKSFKGLPVKIQDNYDLLPSFTDFKDFSKFVYQNSTNDYEESHILTPLFEEIKDNYDVILLDIPPMNKEVTENAVVASDYTIISFQTQERSLTGAENYVSDLLRYKDIFDLNIDIIGILPVLQNRRGSVDQAVIDLAKQTFGEDLIFNTIVPHMERIKRFDITGITDRDRFDKKVMDKYDTVTQELVDRLEKLEMEGAENE